MMYNHPLIWIPSRYKKDTDRFLRLISDANVDIVVTAEPWEYKEFLKTSNVVVLPLSNSISSISELAAIIKESYACKAIGYILTEDEYIRLHKTT